MTDLKKSTSQRQIMEAFFGAYRAFTAKPDEMLARRGLSRVHHRILFFIAHRPGLSVSDLLSRLGVTKQALNIPLRQLVDSAPAADDKRKRLLALTAEGAKLEQKLRQEQIRTLQQVFGDVGEEAVAGWLKVNAALAERLPG